VQSTQSTSGKAAVCISHPAVILGLIAVSYMIVFIGTNWFSRADPAEEDDGEIAIDVLDEEEVYLENGKAATLDSFLNDSNSIAPKAGGCSSSP